MNTTWNTTWLEDAIEHTFITNNGKITREEMKKAATAIIDTIYDEQEEVRKQEIEIARDAVLDALDEWAQVLESYGIKIDIDPKNFIGAMKEAEGGITKEKKKEQTSDDVIKDWVRKCNKDREIQF